MNIERALTIEGWMGEPELRWLAEQAAKYMVIVEIGCWKGRSTTALAENISPGGFIFAVDTWLGSIEHNPPVQGLFEAFWENMQIDIEGGRVIPVRLSSIEASKLDGRIRSADMVFIDGSHDYENIKADIAAWRPLVRPGGIICGHDRGYPPIHQAVHEAFDNVGGETDIWCVQL